MRAMVFDRYGEPDAMHLKDVPVPEPQDGEVLIRVGYSGVNPADSKTRSGATCAQYRYVNFVRVPLIDVLPREDAARAHAMIDTGHVRGKLVLKVAELFA